MRTPRTTDADAARRAVAPSRRSALGGLGGLALLGLAGCSDDVAPQPDPSTSPPTRTPSSGPSEDGAPDPTETTVATARVAGLTVFASADDDAEGQLVLERDEEISGEVVLLVLGEDGDRLEVQLPVRPNGTTGWVDAGDVRLTTHRFALEVALGDHELVVTEGGREVLRTPVGVGRSDRPTPGGDYYVKELLSPPDPGGIYGPYAYGLSGFSTVLTEFRDGEGVIGIHGTNEPDLVGTDVSSGCIRMPNETITRLVEEVGLPLGTPVTIRA